MNTRQLTKVLRSDELLTDVFKGVYASDKLPKEVGNYCFVANVDPASKSGSHWVSFYIDNKNCYFFDSYGRPPMKEFKDYLTQYKLAYNTQRLQSDFSACCGQYCMFYLMMKARFKDFTEYFDENLEENDITVTKWANDNFDLDLEVMDLEFQISLALKSI